MTFEHRPAFDLSQRISFECWLQLTKETQMPVIAKRGGARLVILNIGETPHDSQADVVIGEKTGETLTKIIALVKEKLSR